MARLFIVGAGPGHPDYLSPAAAQALRTSDHIVGYGLYLDLLGELAQGKTRHEAPLGAETERADKALDLAAAGHPTALVSSGDAGIYAMATLVFERLHQRPPVQQAEIAPEVIPGISAMQLAAARAGAPLGHDFCAISLSDLLTPWSVIDNRVQAAGLGDFVVAFYNPCSRRRDWQLEAARTRLQAYRPGDTPVIVARALARDEETVVRTTLDGLASTPVDMLSVVLVGNRETRRFGEWIYTPRGYERKDNI